MRGLVAVLVLLAGPAWADTKSVMGSVAYYGGLAAVDIYTTNKGESQGMVERNPFMQNSDSRYVIWGAKTAVMVALDQTVTPKDRKWIRIFNAALTAGIVTNYLIQEHKQSRSVALSYTIRWK